MMQGANGYEEYANTFIRSRNPTIGLATVREWARDFSRNADILELGCGHGVISSVLIDAGLHLHAIDASPTLLHEFRQRFPQVPTDCAPAEESAFLSRTYDGILAWGLLFLLEEDSQRFVLERAAKALRPGGHLLFTAPYDATEWIDAMTHRPSRSLGATAYKALLQGSGLEVADGLYDEAQNHYYLAVKLLPTPPEAPQAD